MSYYCSRCKKDVDIDKEKSGVSCRHCGHRILVKKRPQTKKHFKAE